MTALNHNTKVFGVQKAKLYAVTADAPGAATTYGSGIQLVGMREIILTESWKEAYLRGDSTLLDYETLKDTVKITIRHGKLSFDAVAVLTGATVADSGATPNRITTATYATGDRAGYWKIDAQCYSVDGMPTTNGDYHLILGKCKIAGSRGFGMKEEDFQDFQFDAVGVPPQGTGSVWYQEVLNETAAAPA